MSRFGFDKMKKQMERLKAELPQQLGNMGVRFFVSSFDKQGWTDSGFQAWKKPKRMITGTPEYKYPKKRDLNRHSRAILVGKSGGTRSGAHIHLRQSVNTSLKSAVWPYIEFAVPQPYARRHNEGLDRMPKRQFIGYSHTLATQMREKINSEMRKVLMSR